MKDEKAFILRTMLVVVRAPLTFIGVLGAPEQASALENKVRYLVLLVDAIMPGEIHQRQKLL